MARSVDLPGRIAALERSKERAKTIPLEEALAAQQMSELLGVSWVTLRDWCNDFPSLEGSSAFVRGGNGIKWQFFPLAMIDALLDHFNADAAKRGVKNADIKRRVGIDIPDTEASTDLADTGRLVSLTLQVQAAKQSQGLYVPAHEVASFLDGYNRKAIDAILGVKAEIDPTGQLPAEVIAAMDDKLREVALRVHEDCEKFIEGFHASIEQERVGAAS